MEAVSLSTEPPMGVRDNVIRILYTLGSDSKRRGSSLALLKGVKNSHPGLTLGTGELLRYHNVPSSRAGA